MTTTFTNHLLFFRCGGIKRSIILKTEKGNIWLFQSNKDIELEESVYMDKNNVKETKQIVLKGITRRNREKIDWSLSKK